LEKYIQADMAWKSIKLKNLMLLAEINPIDLVTRSGL